jgi:hypothetical protein
MQIANQNVAETVEHVCKRMENIGEKKEKMLVRESLKFGILL